MADSDLSRTVDDAGLAVLVQKGDRDAFAGLVERYQGKIYGFIYHFFRNEDIAAELTQETFLRVYRFIKRYDPKRKFSTWIYSVAKNICIDEQRKLKRDRSISLDDLPPGTTVTPTDAAHLKNPADISLDLEQRVLVEEAVAILPEKYRTAIILCYFQELSYQEIADILGLSLNLVKVRIFRAKKQLLEIIKARGEEEAEVEGRK